MPKSEAGDEEEVPRYKNSAAQDLEANRQIQKKIDMSFRKVSQASFQKYAKNLEEKNTYWTTSKIPEVNSKDIAEDKMNTIHRFSGALKSYEPEDYCPKCTSKTNPCPHKKPREQIKDKYDYPITSSSVYGWFQPYDNLGENHNLNSVTASFFDQTHL